MSYVPERSKLCGLPYEVAERYGKPHVGARYASGSVYSHVPEQGARCAVCGRPASNVHHDPPLSKGRVFTLRTGWGAFVLTPALFALCGSGTAGCHGGFHGGARYKARWAWDSDEHAEAWWEGEILKRTPEHSRSLYLLGRWEIEDRLAGMTYEVRGTA